VTAAPVLEQSTPVRPLAWATPLRGLDTTSPPESDAGVRVLRGTKRVSVTDPYLGGHFPGLTLYPGLFLLETLRELVTADHEGPTAPPVLRSVRSLRCLALLLGGEEFTVRAKVRTADPAGGISVRAEFHRADGVRAASANVTFGPEGGRTPAPEPTEDEQAHVDAAGADLLEHGVLRSVLPHGWPILLLDRVSVLVPGREAVAAKAVTGTEPCYAGLPVGLPAQRYAYPAALLMESFGQAAAVLWLASPVAADDDPRAVLMFAAATDCHIDAPAFPGDVLRHVVSLERVVDGTAFATGSTWVGSRRIARWGCFVAVRRPPGSVVPPGRTVSTTTAQGDEQR
jgi:3-hydroxymyristoyl/3-hydroxydecanoyl-(acyl carrier protein) dehydratase